VPISVRFLPEKRIVLQVGSGDIRPADIDQAIDNTRDAVFANNPRGVVIDTRADTVNIPMEAWIDLIADYFEKIGTHVPTAYVIDGGVTPDQSMLLELTGFNNGTPVRVFATLEEAVDWVAKVARSR